MSVIFTSTIKMDADDTWYIELKDMADERVELCRTLDEYAQKIEALGSDYGGHIDAVNWYKDEDVPHHVLDEIRLEMAKQKALMEES